MMIRKCRLCGKNRWAQGHFELAKRDTCKPCRHKSGERDVVREPRPVRIKKAWVALPLPKPTSKKKGKRDARG
jgi:hypothetical protein